MHEMTPETMHWAQERVKALEELHAEQAAQMDAELAHLRHIQVTSVGESALHPRGGHSAEELLSAAQDGRLISD